MDNAFDIAQINLTVQDGKKASWESRFQNSQLIISDDLIKSVLTNNGLPGDSIIRRCEINIGANNIAVVIKDYTVTETVNISAFYNVPSTISIFQSHGTNVHIVNQSIELLQLDCQDILLADCKVKQFDVGLSEYSAALKQASAQKDDSSQTAYKMKSLDLRSCYITSLKAYAECDNVNIQDTSIDTLCFMGNWGSKVQATIAQVNIWSYSKINILEIYCTISKFISKDSSISTLVAKGKCHLVSIEMTDTDIYSAHNFKKGHFEKLDLLAWTLIRQSATSANNTSIKAKANYQIAKETYSSEKGLHKVLGELFGFCTGYGYKPMRICWAFLILVLCSCLIFSIRFYALNKCIDLNKVINYLIISIAAIAGQSGLTLNDGFEFWIATAEYLAGVVLFAMFVNALYVRYKD